MLSSSGETHRPWCVRNDAGTEKKWGLMNFLPLICSYRAAVLSRSWAWGFIWTLGAIKRLNSDYATGRKWKSSPTDLLLTWKFDPLCHSSPQVWATNTSLQLVKTGCNEKYVHNVPATKKRSKITHVPLQKSSSCSAIYIVSLLNGGSWSGSHLQYVKALCVVGVK